MTDDWLDSKVRKVTQLKLFFPPFQIGEKNIESPVRVKIIIYVQLSVCLGVETSRDRKLECDYPGITWQLRSGDTTLPFTL